MHPYFPVSKISQLGRRYPSWEEGQIRVLVLIARLCVACECHQTAMLTHMPGKCVGDMDK